MAELATIARPYAEALFKSAQADLNAAAQWVDELGAIAGNAQLLQFADNPKVTTQQVFDVVDRRCEGGAARGRRRISCAP